MRTLVIGRGAEQDGSGVWTGVVTPLTACGHDVLALDVSGPGAPEAHLAEATAAADRFQPELVVVVPTPGDLPDDGVSAAFPDALVVAVHARTAWSLAPTRLADLDRHVAAYDVVTVPDEWTLRALGRGRCSVMRLDIGVDPDTLDRAADRHDRLAPVVVLGDADPDNVHAARRLVDAGLDIGLVGRGWAAHPDLTVLDVGIVGPFDRLAAIASAELVVELPPTVAVRSLAGLALDECPLGSDALSAAALGIPVVAVARPGVGAVLEPGAEVLVAPDADGLVDLVSLVMTTSDELADLSVTGQVRVRRDHASVDAWRSFLVDLGAPVATSPGRSAVAHSVSSPSCGLDEVASGRCALTALRPDILTAVDRHAAAAAAYLELADEVGPDRPGLRSSLLDRAADHLDDDQRDLVSSLRAGDGAGLRALILRLRTTSLPDPARAAVG